MNAAPFREFNRLAETVVAFRRSKPLLVALRYDLFTWVERGWRTADRLSRRLGLDRRALGILLDAVVSLGYLAKQGDRYANTALSRRLLVSTSPHYRGNVLKYQEAVWDAWSELGSVVKTGRPRLSLRGWVRKDGFAGEYVRAMGEVAMEAAQDLAGKLPLRGVSRMLDVGCGAGTYGAALVERNPGMEATLLDLPATLRVTRRLLKAHPCADRFRFRPADFLADGFGREEFDLVLISNVTHVEDERNNLRLVEKAHRALRPGGRLVIHDIVIEPTRTAPGFAALLAVHLLVFTGRGNVYTFDEYAGWMRRKGFRGISRRCVAVRSLYPTTAVIGRKA